MMKVSLNEMAAFEFISVKDLLTSAMNGFSENGDIRSKENADLCFKALESFLK